jgi:hypothetical protein
MQDDERIGIEPSAAPSPRDEDGGMLTEVLSDRGVRQRSDN